MSREGSIVAGVFWMFVISVALFFLPVLGPFVAGLVGGKKSGGVGRALTAVFLPALVFGAVMFTLATALTGWPLLGILAGMGGAALALAHIGPLLLGAILGGAFA